MFSYPRIGYHLYKMGFMEVMGATFTLRVSPRFVRLTEMG